MKKRKASLSFTPQKTTLHNFFSSTSKTQPQTQQKKDDDDNKDKDNHNNNNNGSISTPNTPLTRPSTPLSTTPENLQIIIQNNNSDIEIEKHKTISNNENNHPHIPYYLKNFLLILETVWEKDTHLFFEEEVVKVESFRNLPHCSKLLFVRLITRKGPWFSIADLKYSEINDINDAINCITKCNLAHQIPTTPSPSLLVDVVSCFFTVDQLKHVVRECGIQLSKNHSSSSPKDHLLETVSNRILNSPIVAKCVENMLGKCVKIDEQIHEIFEKINLLYFLNPSQNATTILLNDMEILNSPKYRVWGKVGIGNSKSIFKNREDFNEYRNALVIEGKMSEALKAKNDEVCLCLMEESALFLATNSLKLETPVTTITSSNNTNTINNIHSHTQNIPSLEKQNNILDTALTTQEIIEESPFQHSNSINTSTSHIENTSTPSNHFTTLSTSSSSSSLSLSFFQNESNDSPTPKTLHTPNYILTSLDDFTSSTIQPTQHNNTQLSHNQILTTSNEKENSQDFTTTSSSSSNLNLDLLFIAFSSTFLSQFSAAYIHTRILHHSIAILEKQKRYEEATFHLRTLLNGSYNSSKRGKWWNRLVINLEHLGQLENALSVCEMALKDPTVKTGHRLEVEQRLIRLCKPPRRWSVPTNLLTITPLIQPPKEVYIRGKIYPIQKGNRRLYLDYEGTSSLTVEQFALQYYQLSGDWIGQHSEGGILINLYILLFWDIIWNDNIPYVFQTPYQVSPLDLTKDYFYSNRKEFIDNRLELIESEIFDELFEMSWAHFGEVCTGVNWNRNTKEELIMISKCIGGNALSKICKIFAQDYKAFSRGGPDLLLYKCVDNKYYSKFVEVKSPNDKLSLQQKIWIDLLISCGVSVDVCHVREPDNQNLKEKRKREKIETWEDDQMWELSNQH